MGNRHPTSQDIVASNTFSVSSGGNFQNLDKTILETLVAMAVFNLASMPTTMVKGGMAAKSSSSVSLLLFRRHPAPHVTKAQPTSLPHLLTSAMTASSEPSRSTVSIRELVLWTPSSSNFTIGVKRTPLFLKMLPFVRFTQKSATTLPSIKTWSGGPPLIQSSRLP